MKRLRLLLLALLVGYFLVGTSLPVRMLLAVESGKSDPVDQPYEEQDEKETKSEVEKLEGDGIELPSERLSLLEGFERPVAPDRPRAPQPVTDGPDVSRGPPRV